MPSEHFSIESDGPLNLEVSWDGGLFYPQKNIRLSFEGQSFGAIATRAELKDGREFLMPDNSKLAIKLANGSLQLSRNGQLLNKIEHPKREIERLISLFQSWGVMSIAFAVLGIFKLFGGASTGSVALMLGAGALLLGLCYFAKRRLLPALFLSGAVAIIQMIAVQILENTWNLSLILLAIYIFTLTVTVIRLIYERKAASNNS